MRYGYSIPNTDGISRSGVTSSWNVFKKQASQKHVLKENFDTTNFVIN